MLDSETKRRIDACRDILVGKVPDPKSQVEQITLALIYKFMDDMDAEAEELGGKRAFFAGPYAQYAWRQLLLPGIGGQKMLNLYAEALDKLDQNPGIPGLFRDIFKNAYLPYRDPETLRAFLRQIDGFSYDHSERLGDAFEYLLQVLGSQGDAGQFRTPRHIIDFMVAVVDPHKSERILDPACGTAGFLISAYKHILHANKKTRPGDQLKTAEQKTLIANFSGYDISPDMVRLSRVNLYLHGFPDPHIFEYDTLTSEERWQDRYDVILANPPFMSPKGGIRPHKRFSVPSNRSEVLFLDYIYDHLTTHGRAAVVVPEGVIFQSGTAYKTLRKLLVEKALVAVVSLPAGVFNPYSGVKTSILFLDRDRAARTDSVAFVKITNDGYALNAQRREGGPNDLPAAQQQLKAYFKTLDAGKLPLDTAAPNFQLVAKTAIGENGEWNLSGERYGLSKVVSFEYPMVEIGDVVEILDRYRRPITSHDRVAGPYPYYGATGIVDHVSEYLFDEPLVLVGEDGAKWGIGDKTAFAISGKTWVNNHAHVLRPLRDQLLDTYFIEVINQMDLAPYITGVTVPKLNQEKLRSIEIPLPPLEVQREIVAEIDAYQQVIAGARQVLEQYQPRIPIDPAWPVVEIGEVTNLINGRAFNADDWQPAESGGYPIIRIQNLNNEAASFNYYVGEVNPKHQVEPGTLLFSWSGSRGTSFGPHIWRRNQTGVLNQHIFKVEHGSNYDRLFLYFILKSVVEEVEDKLHGGVGLVHITKGNLESIKIPLPPLPIQQAIVAEIEAEQRLVAANRELIERMEARVRAAIGRVWGAAVPVVAPEAAPAPLRRAAPQRVAAAAR